ncbi:SDR family NAD(P)-dependent oxidoreductase [Flavobacterium sp. 102]|uniref:SDR family NAD(P)-dependent oxidoreductase n=1 Tax=Flavobacterium sp. 102 TaxID=2135623 RepID=UPI000EB2DAD8|nr:SDR family oxidoreductase [Flavobacterium sp. 102]RKS01876.1 NAD(P)-dependent dehydrogenase (short-subunit alcohol dehydrogenase family) [Flavobacterium sp. 102]
MNSLFSLNNKTILVTGASSGIGRSVSEMLAHQGATVIMTARNEERLQITLQSLPKGNHQYFSTDLTSDEAIKELVAQLPALDGIILNAGMVKTVPVQFIKRDDLDYMFDLMLHSSILLLQQLLKSKKLKPEASVCFISSVASQKITIGNAIYSAAKGALNSFTKSLALEVAPKQIRVNAILPGMVQTAILESGTISEEQLQAHLKNYPLGRFGQPEDIAGLTVYLMADVSKWMTGSLLTLDGGYTLK